MITIVTGGARSGKSDFAESLYAHTDDVCYIATSIVADDEMENRVKLHRESRNQNWRTFEGYTDLHQALGTEANYLLDCMTILISNIMYDLSKDEEDLTADLIKKIEDKAYLEIANLIYEIREQNKNLVLVTNEVGSAIVPENKVARSYRDIVGRVNRRVAEICDRAYLIVMGYEVRLK